MSEERPKAKFLRLKNGDDLIAETVETEDKDGVYYTVFNPLKVFYSPSESIGYLSIAFMPWVFPKICDNQEFNIHDDDLLLISDISEKMNTYYWENIDYLHNKSSEKTVKETEEEQLDEASLSDIIKELTNKRTFH